MQRKLRAFSGRSAKNQQTDDRRRRAKRARIAPQQAVERTEIQRTKRCPDRQDAQNETEVAQAIRNKCFLARIGRFGPFEPKPDEEIAGYANQLPKNKELDEIVCQDDAEH